MFVMQIIAIRLKDSAKDKISARAFERISEWLTQWTPIANFKAVMAESNEIALDICKNDLQQNLLPSWLAKDTTVTPDQFEFEVSYQELKGGRFWLNSQLVWAHWHSVPALATECA